MTVYCFDIDGTICTNTDGDYIDKKLEKLNGIQRPRRSEHRTNKQVQ